MDFLKFVLIEVGILALLGWVYLVAQIAKEAFADHDAPATPRPVRLRNGLGVNHRFETYVGAYTSIDSRGSIVY